MLSSSRIQSSKKDPQIPRPCTKYWRKWASIQFPKKSEGTTFRVKVGDKDLITRNKTTKLIDAINYKMNNWGHYIWIILQLT